MEISEDIDDTTYNNVLLLGNSVESVLTIEEADHVIINTDDTTSGTIPILNIADDGVIIDGQSFEATELQGVEENIEDGTQTVIGHIYRVNNRLFLIPHPKEDIEETIITVRNPKDTEDTLAQSLIKETIKKNAPKIKKTTTEIKKKPKKQGQPKKHPCLISGCEKSYTSVIHLKVHIRSHIGVKPYHCSVVGCSKAFSTMYGRTAHERIHTNEKPYPCTDKNCAKAFRTSGDLLKHMRTHTGERPFKCTFEGCNKAFTTSNIRQVHMRSHTGERPFVCDLPGCGRRFSTFTNRKNHVRIHTGEKPFACSVEGCGKRFTEYSSLYKHHAVHNQKRRFDCTVCGKKYRYMSSLNIHHNSCHLITNETDESNSTQQLQSTNVVNLKRVSGTIIKFETEELSDSPFYLVDNDFPGIGLEDSDLETYKLNYSLE